MLGRVQMMINKKLFYILVGFLVLSCSSESVCELKLEPLDQVLISKISEEFDKNGISYDLFNKDTLCIPYNKISSAAVIYKEVIDENIPSDRSISLDSNILHNIVRNFKSKNIPYKVHMQNKYKFIVWDKKDSSLAKKIIEEERNKYIDQYFKNK